MDQQSSSDRVRALLDHLGLGQVHVGACMSSDWGSLLQACPERVASLTVIAPHLNKGIPSAAATFAGPVFVVTGGVGAPAERARKLEESFSSACLRELCELPGYESPMWSDTVSDRRDEVIPALTGFLGRAAAERPLPAAAPARTEGHHEGIRFSVRGAGPPLLLYPLSLAPSQWAPVLDALAAQHCVITVGGAHLGPVVLLEERAESGYAALVDQVLHGAGLGPGPALTGRSVIEIGCGSGALARRLAARMDTDSRLAATDVNAFLLTEARALAESEGLLDRISFQEMNGEALVQPDHSFDAAMCCTVMEEGDADRMLREMVRVVRPGGQVVVMVRAMDVDWWINLPVPAKFRRKLNALGPRTGSGVDANGCAEGSIYARAIAAGARPLELGPRCAVYRQGARLADVLARLITMLSEREADDFRTAVEAARAEGTLFVCEPFHCLVAQVGQQRS